MTATRAAVLALVFCLAQEAGAQEERHPRDAAAILAAMTDPRLPHEQLLALEEELKARPVREALPALMASPHRKMPEGGIYNGGTPEIEKSFPHRWRLFYSLARAETWLRRNAPIDELLQAMQLFDPSCDVHEARLRVYWECWSRIPEGIVESARIVFEDEKRPLGKRLLAARSLLQFDREASYGVVCDFAIEHGVASSLLRDFARLYPGKKDHHPRLIDQAFQAVARARAASPDYAFAAYFQAMEAGRLVGQEFYPKPKDPLAKVDRDALARATVEAALAWWEAHKAARK